VTLAKTAGRTALRLANAGSLPFDFRSLYKAINGYVSEVIGMADQMRESTLLENQLIREKFYQHTTDTALKLLPPAPKEEVPFLNFSSLQNAMTAMQKATEHLSSVLAGAKPDQAKQDEVNRSLYQAEQKLLTENGLPRRGWYRHAIYAPGFYTGYGVKTLPGIREAIEQRKWKEAQQEIEEDAGVIRNFSIYLDGIAAKLP
jgi:N-acetylated-alpha-linked acidic dipeptidase